jgi:hypothetical protein
MHPKNKGLLQSCPVWRTQNSEPSPGGIRIYFAALHELFSLYHIYFSRFALHLEKKIKFPWLH